MIVCTNSAVLEQPARLGWALRVAEVAFDPEQPYAVIWLTPEFPHCANNLVEYGIVWDLEALIASVRRPGAHYVLNRDCGYPPDSDIEQAVLVSHPDDRTVVWELDIAGLRPAIDDSIGGEGFLRFIFDRAAYEADVRAMLREVQQAARTPVPVASLPVAATRESLARDWPDLPGIPVQGYEPAFENSEDIDVVVAQDAAAPWPREPLFEPGTVIDIGLFGGELWQVDGPAPQGDVYHMLTRWEVLDAFRRWMATVVRRFAVGVFLRAGADVDSPTMRPTSMTEGTVVSGNPNDFILRPGVDPETCHQAGEAFAEIFGRCLAEAETAPGVTLRYLRRPVAAA